jgi:hypothetical protein
MEQLEEVGVVGAVLPVKFRVIFPEENAPEVEVTETVTEPAPELVTPTCWTPVEPPTKLAPMVFVLN